jgi:hypothetical protein
MIRNAAGAVAVAVLALVVAGVNVSSAEAHSVRSGVSSHGHHGKHHAVKQPRPECPPTFGYAPPRPPGVCR